MIQRLQGEASVSTRLNVEWRKSALMFCCRFNCFLAAVGIEMQHSRGFVVCVLLRWHGSIISESYRSIRIHQGELIIDVPAQR
jgi:hypothetical protein